MIRSPEPIDVTHIISYQQHQTCSLYAELHLIIQNGGSLREIRPSPICFCTKYYPLGIHKSNNNININAMALS